MQANAARLAYRYCRHQLRSPSAREEGDVSLPEPLNGAILAPMEIDDLVAYLATLKGAQ